MVLGIDLGTTYSVAAYVDENGEPHAIYNAEGDTTTPSVVYFEDDKNVVVGQIAKDFKATEPKRVISTVKNVIGENKVYKPLPNTSFAPQDISSFVLRKLVKDAEMFLGGTETIKDVVVTVPAYFTEAQRSATNEAVKLAGLNLISNINEPTAAAVFYAHKSKMEETKTLVFDLGGGTFDVTLMHIKGSDVEVLGTQGLKNVGGSFFDQQLVDYICEQFDEKYGIDLEDDEFIDVYNSLYEKVEKAKKQICTNKSQTVIPVNAGTAKDRVVITYDYFLSIIAKPYDKIANLVNVVIQEAGLSKNDVDQVIMVGGSSRIPYIEEEITKLIGKTPLKVVNPDEVVALGAAIHAEKLSKNKCNTVKDVCSHGIGFLRYSPKDENKYNVVMVPRNTQLPASASNNLFAFASDNQKVVKFTLTESDYEDAIYAVEIKSVSIDLPDGIKKGMEYIVELVIDEKQNITININIPNLSKDVSVSLADNKENPKETEDKERIEKQAAYLQQISIA